MVLMLGDAALVGQSVFDLVMAQGDTSAPLSPRAQGRNCVTCMATAMCVGNPSLTCPLRTRHILSQYAPAARK